jgi:fumarylacetoacetate (FAA) hydrolase
MKLATVKNGSPDGRLVVVSSDGLRYAEAQGATTLQAAIENWEGLAASLGAEAKAVECSGATLDKSSLAAPLPRAWQWLDGSAFTTHGELMQIAFHMDPVPTDRPLMYQGISNQFYGPHDDVPFPNEADGIDFEGEFGVIVDEVPMGVTPEEALSHVKLIIQINDWSLRAIAPIEMNTGFGWVQAKPPCSVAPFAVTPDELGDAWKDGRVCLDLAIDWNGNRFGTANGREMAFGFHELVAHAARTRKLCAGTIIGSGTVSNTNYREVGSSCVSERRAIEMIDFGAPKTPFMAFGDCIEMEARTLDGATLFGSIAQRVVSVPE